MAVEMSQPVYAPIRSESPNKRADEQLDGQIRDYSAFDPKAYIQEYYSLLGSENEFLLRFHHEVYSKLPPGGRLLEFGGGPTIYQILSAARSMKEIVFAEYLDCNRKELVKWLFGSADAVDWNAYLDYVSMLENIEVKAESREQLTKRVASRLTQIVECDAYMPNILSPRRFQPFDVVSSSFCLECITGDESQFVNFMLKLSACLRVDGTLVLALLKNASSYKVGNKLFPVFPLTEPYIAALLKTLNFGEIDMRTAPAEADQGYEGLIALTAKKMA